MCRLFGGFSSRRKTQGLDWGAAVRQSVGRCPLCGNDVAGHGWGFVGSAKLGTLEESGLRDALRERNWAAVTEHCAESMLVDFRDISALACPAAQRTVIFETLSYFEPFVDDELVQTLPLSANESKDVERATSADRWRVIPAASD